MGLRRCCDGKRFPELLQHLAELVEDDVLRFPRAVMMDLKVLARDEQITAWAIGLSKKLSNFAVDIEYKIPVMNMLQAQFGYEAGLEDMDGSDPSIIELVAAACMFEELSIEFWIVSEDRGSTPLRPTMEEICRLRTWPILSASEGVKNLGLQEYLAQP